jgi:hypothetical protein
MKMSNSYESMLYFFSDVSGVHFNFSLKLVLKSRL